MNYVTYDQNGKLTGAYLQDLHPSHANNHIEVTDAVRLNWVQYQANAARDGVELAPVVPVSLAVIRADKSAQVRAERDRRKFNGVQVQGKWIHTDTYSRTQWLGMVMMGAAIPQIAWTTMDGTTINTSQTLAGQVFQATAALDQALFAKAAALIAQIEASNDPATVDITTGWQATYGG